MKRQTLVRATIAAAALFALAGCGHMHESSAPSAMMETYTATLAPGEEVPPAANSKGSGTFEMWLNIATNEFTYKATWTGLTGPSTAGHVHGPADPGKNAGVVVPFPDVAGKAATEGKGKLTQAQYGDLAAGLYYVNIHTAQYPGGEIRGQVKRK